jgi:hypothetical protein
MVPDRWDGVQRFDALPSWRGTEAPSQLTALAKPIASEAMEERSMDAAAQRAAKGGQLVAALVAWAIVGPSPASAAPTVAELANYAGSDRQQVLEAGAKAEGTLTIYTTGTQIAPLVDRFKQKYPFVRVQLLRASSVEIATKVT